MPNPVQHSLDVMPNPVQHSLDVMPNPVQHSLDVFAMQPILHVYIERNGYALEAPPEEDIHPPSHNEKLLGAKQQLASLSECFEMIPSPLG